MIRSFFADLSSGEVVCWSKLWIKLTVLLCVRLTIVRVEVVYGASGKMTGFLMKTWTSLLIAMCGAKLTLSR